MLSTRPKRSRKRSLELCASGWKPAPYTRTRRHYSYGALGRPFTHNTGYPQKEEQHTTAFGYNQRSELTSAQVSGELYGYDYDNIGNRRLAFGGADYAVYTANELNQYTKIDTNGNDFTPEYDADGNQTKVKTATGVWHVTYNAQNRAVKFEREDGNTIIECAYDYMGRRIEKKVTTDGTVTLHERYLYRSYLQIAAVDLLANTTKHAILWNPTQPTATRPLAIQQGKKWHTYAWDLTKNITALFTSKGAISATYTYTPFGKVTIQGDVDQDVQWSSEYNDKELGLVYYNYRYYNPQDGRWTRRDPIEIKGESNLYGYLFNNTINYTDFIGLAQVKEFKFYETYRMENHGQTLIMANIEQLARAASEVSEMHITEISDSIRVMTDTSAIITGKQFRYFLRFECVCDNGCLLFNIGATKPKIKTRHFVVTTNSLGVGNDAHNAGFSAFIPIPPNYLEYVNTRIDYIVNLAEQECASKCAAI